MLANSFLLNIHQTQNNMSFYVEWCLYVLYSLSFSSVLISTNSRAKYLTLSCSTKFTSWSFTLHRPNTNTCSIYERSSAYFGDRFAVAAMVSKCLLRLVESGGLSELSGTQLHNEAILSFTQIQTHGSAQLECFFSLIL